MNEPLVLQVAREEIERYSDTAIDPVLHAHLEAQDCHDCEDFLMTGIRAFRTLSQGEEFLRKGACLGIIEWTAELDGALRVLYTAWLAPCTRADLWIERQMLRGYRVNGRDEYQECCEAAREWLSRDSMYEANRAAREARFAEDPW